MKKVKEAVKQEAKENVDYIQEAGEMNEQEETYKIYEYLKKNPGVFAVSGAAIITALSYLISFCSYLFESAKLNYWNIDPIYINPYAASRLYGTIASFIFLCLLFVVFSVNEMLAEKSAPVMQKEFYYKKIKKEYQKEVTMQILLRLLPRCFRTSSDKTQGNHSANARKTIENLKKRVLEQKKEMNRQIRAQQLLVVFLLSLSIFIWICIVVNVSPVPFFVKLVVSVAASILLTTLMFKTAQNAFIDKKNIKKEAVQQYNALEIKADVPQAVFPLKKILSGDYSLKHPDRKIKRATANFLIIIVFVVTALLICFLFWGSQNAKEQTQFLITSVDGGDYAIIYNNGENAILVRCEEAGNTLTIDSSYQKVVSIEGLDYSIRQYKKVERRSITLYDIGGRSPVSSKAG